jgi:hypothetical protein
MAIAFDTSDGIGGRPSAFTENERRQIIQEVKTLGKALKRPIAIETRCQRLANHPSKDRGSPQASEPLQRCLIDDHPSGIWLAPMSQLNHSTLTAIFTKRLSGTTIVEVKKKRMDAAGTV